MNETIDRDSLKTESLFKDCIEALQRVAAFRLPKAMDQRLLWLAQNKESLTQAEHDELLALAEFAEQRSLEKVQAQAVLKRFGERYPELF